MMELTTYHFSAGLIAMGHMIAGLFFLRFWHSTRDRLFLAFAAAFWLLALAQGSLALTREILEERSWIYWLRVAAFGLIILAVVRKNRGSRRG